TNEICNNGHRRCDRALQHGRLCAAASYVERQGPSRYGPHGPAASELRQSERKSGWPDLIERNRLLGVRRLGFRYFRLQLTESPALRGTTAPSSVSPREAGRELKSASLP